MNETDKINTVMKVLIDLKFNENLLGDLNKQYKNYLRIQHLERASKEVKSWPSWKRNLHGGKPV